MKRAKFEKRSQCDRLGSNSHADRRHAIVIGGSIAGLLTARILSDHFSQVTLIERDRFSDRAAARKSQPHAQHSHALLTQGKEILHHYFPDLLESLEQGGAVAADAGKSRWYIAGKYRLQYESGMTGISCSRPFLEQQIRNRVILRSNISVLDECLVEGLLTRPDPTAAKGSIVIGVKLRTVQSADALAVPRLTADVIMADLVVDASGRNSASPHWLTNLGYEKLSESKITVGVKYTTRIYRRSPEDLPGAPSLVISPNLPNNQTAGVAVPIEGDRWMVTLVGWTEPPPRDDAGFLAFAQALPAPDIGNLIRQAEPLSDAVGYEYRCGLRHHYEKLSRFPTGYLVMGDAFCSFDPIYGQGMTSALMQAALLDRLLEQSVNAPQLARQFFKQAAKIIDIPWQMTVNEDFRLPTTQGKKPLGTDLINAYTRLVQQATHTDPVVYTAFLRAMNLVAPPSSLFHLHILWRVFQANRRPAAPQLHYSRDRRIVLDKTPG